MVKIVLHKGVEGGKRRGCPTEGRYQQVKEDIEEMGRLHQIIHKTLLSRDLL